MPRLLAKQTGPMWTAPGLPPRTWMWERALDSRCGEKDGEGYPSIGSVNAITLDF